ncbi:hypothetical protein CRYUN_Cryun23aG0029600 [Craigia yunnanensis]
MLRLLLLDVARNKLEIGFAEDRPAELVFKAYKLILCGMESAWKECCYIYTHALKIGRIKRMRSSQAGAEIFFAEKARTLLLCEGNVILELQQYISLAFVSKGLERNRELSDINEKQARIRNPAAIPEEICRQFSLAEIKAATNNFHQDLIIGQGFCNDKDEMILVYEYMRNRTLRDHLYGSGNDSLPWKQRLEICIGAARGLHYLHTGAKQAIIHRDIKSTNIVLEDTWVLRFVISEYARGHGLTGKSDVFSFGVLLFEVLCARKVFDRSLNDNQVCLVPWARQSIEVGTIYNIIDPYLKGRIAPECFMIFVDIAYSCTCLEGNTGPEMGEVEVMLQRALDLQAKADFDKVHLAPYGEYMHEEVSFCALVPEYSSRVDSFGVEGDTGVTYSTLDSSSFTEYLSSDDTE